MFYVKLNEQENEEYLINKSIAEIEENALGRIFLSLFFMLKLSNVSVRLHNIYIFSQMVFLYFFCILYIMRIYTNVDFITIHLKFIYCIFRFFLLGDATLFSDVI